MTPAATLLRACALALWLWPSGTPAQPVAPAVDDPRFREAYTRRYDALKGVAPDMVVMVLRDRVEFLASSGGQVGAASNDRRVRGFESALLLGLQAVQCNGAAPGPARPSGSVVEKVSAAANSQRLRTQSADVAELAAMAQRLLDQQPRERWCALKSLDEIR